MKIPFDQLSKIEQLTIFKSYFEQIAIDRKVKVLEVIVYDEYIDVLFDLPNIEKFELIPFLQFRALFRSNDLKTNIIVFKLRRVNVNQFFYYCDNYFKNTPYDNEQTAQ